MKYEIAIEGGFTGISRRFKGEIELDQNERDKIIESLKDDSSLPFNDQLRDGMLYRLRITDNDEEFNTVFDEMNIPEVIRDFIASIKKK